MDEMKHNAILAISDAGEGFLVRWTNNEDWMEEQHRECDILPEMEIHEKAGLYYAIMVGSYCGGGGCSGMGECPGDCFEAEWRIISPLVLL